MPPGHRKPSTRTRAAVLWALLAATAGADYLTEQELGLSLLYLVPIALGAWQVGPGTAASMALAAAAGWLGMDLFLDHPTQRPWMAYVDAGVHVSLVGSIIALVTRLRHALTRERELSRVDPLTRAWNARAFKEFVGDEIARLQRFARPFTLVYLDADGFKAVNDQLGHATGDEVLRAIVATLRTRCRAVDSVARLGGDEFAVLLPETDSAAAEAVLKDLPEVIATAMQARGWGVTASVGAITFLEAPDGVEDALARADRCMYDAKTAGKNRAHHAVVANPSSRPAVETGAATATGATGWG